jgi:hypothetical protein
MEHSAVLMTIYNTFLANLSPIGGLEKGWALDFVFQEIVIETGDLVFE